MALAVVGIMRLVCLLLSLTAVIALVPASSGQLTSEVAAAVPPESTSCLTAYVSDMVWTTQALEFRVFHVALPMIQSGEYLEAALYLVSDVAVDIPLVMVDNTQGFVSCVVGP